MRNPYYYSTPNKADAEAAARAVCEAFNVPTEARGYEFAEVRQPRGAGPGHPEYDSTVIRWGVYRLGEPGRHGFASSECVARALDIDAGRIPNTFLPTRLEDTGHA
jgi:hypothetical protein